MKKVSFDIDGKTIEGFVAQKAGVLWAHVNGETFTVETARKSRKGGKSSGAGAKPGEVVAPMPGKVIKLLVKPGMKVENHQVVLVMEAMKMEYTLKAACDGVVTDVFCDAGQQVTLGQLLVKLDVK
ncbi:MAG TPA: biotin/lipoyl-containing protein [Bdellovibrionales bacterium]|nr:biotin/lipoyl-containing protein [Bdellovibrionales bacterium]